MPPPGRELAALGAAGSLLFLALFFSGGSSDGPLFWIGSLALLAAAVLVAAALLGWLPWPAPSRGGIAFAVLLSAFVLWNGISISWSIESDRSWGYTNRGLAYLAFAVIGLFAGALVRPRRLAALVAALDGLVLAWALAGKVIPALASDNGRIARLRSPIGYWNALALLAAGALVLGLWLVGRRTRVAGALLAYAAVVSALLTYSRAGVILAVVCALAWLALTDSRLESLAVLALAGASGVAVFGVALALPGVSNDGQPHSVRVHDGLLFGLALIVGAAVVLAVARAAPRLEARNEDRIVAGALAAAAVVVVAALAVSVVRAGGPGSWLDARAREFVNPNDVQQESARLSTVSSNHRWRWWNEAWNAFEDRPLGGVGAGAFELVHLEHRKGGLDRTTEPHSLPLQFAAETGIVGLALLLGAAAAAIAGAVGALRRLGGNERPAALALALGALAYALYALVDFDWDFLAVTAPTLVVAGTLAAAGREPAHAASRRPLYAVGAVAVAFAAAFSLASPWLAQRKLDDAAAAIDRRDLLAASEAAREAHSLDPLALQPLLVRATVEAALGDRAAARQLYVEAVRLQPKNSEAWYELGVFELELGRRPVAAYVALNNSYTYDRFGPASVKGGPLDRARAIVNELAARNRRRARGAHP